MRRYSFRCSQPIQWCELSRCAVETKQNHLTHHDVVTYTSAGFTTSQVQQQLMGGKSRTVVEAQRSKFGVFLVEFGRRGSADCAVAVLLHVSMT